jgi:hypothetical protein
MILHFPLLLLIPLSVRPIAQQHHDAVVELLGFTAPQNAMVEEAATKPIITTSYSVLFRD